MKTFDRLLESSKFIQSRSKIQPKLAFILGSGLSSFGEMIEVDAKFKFGEIPGFYSSTVEGHPGQLLMGHLEGIPVAVMQGRLHAYEGLSLQDVVFPVRSHLVALTFESEFAR